MTSLLLILALQGTAPAAPVPPVPRPSATRWLLAGGAGGACAAGAVFGVYPAMAPSQQSIAFGVAAVLASACSLIGPLAVEWTAGHRPPIGPLLLALGLAYPFALIGTASTPLANNPWIFVTALLLPSFAAAGGAELGWLLPPGFEAPLTRWTLNIFGGAAIITGTLAFLIAAQFARGVHPLYFGGLGLGVLGVMTIVGASTVKPWPEAPVVTLVPVRDGAQVVASVFF